MKKIFALSLLGVLGSPLISHAATYHYLDIYGVAHDVDAPTAAQALSAVNPLQTTMHTGVALDQGVLVPGELYGQDYSYVNTQGSLVTIHAASLDAAKIIASDKDPNSGFLIGGLE